MQCGWFPTACYQVVVDCCGLRLYITTRWSTLLDLPILNHNTCAYTETQCTQTVSWTSTSTVACTLIELTISSLRVRRSHHTPLTQLKNVCNEPTLLSQFLITGGGLWRVLWPILFLIYVNSLTLSLTSTFSDIFADDTTLGTCFSWCNSNNKAFFQN